MSKQEKPKQQKFSPLPTPETQHYWDGAKRGELLIQQCDGCAHYYFPPRPFCPKCASRDVTVRKASGKASLYSYVISHQLRPGQEGPFAIAVVELAEGPRMMTNIVGCAQTPEALQLDMPLQVTFEEWDDVITLPKFTPAKNS